MWRNPLLLEDERFWDYMQDAYVDLATPVIEMGAETGATYYELAGGRGVVASPPPPDALRTTARWAMSRGNAVTGLQLLSGSMVGHIYSAAQDSVKLSAESEPGAKWARRARADACPFCRMLATRGDVYSSSKTAVGEDAASRYHDHCRCLAVAVRPNEVWHPPAYVQQWEEQYKEVTRRVGTSNPQAITNAWKQALADGSLAS